jgi:hypothetical protein
VEGKPSLITVEFLKRGEQTELVLTHSRFATVESRDNHARGWGKIAESFAGLWRKHDPPYFKAEILSHECPNRDGSFVVRLKLNNTDNG